MAAGPVSHADLLSEVNPPGLQLQLQIALCIDSVSQLRQVAYNLVALETGQPKSPSGANDQH